MNYSEHSICHLSDIDLQKLAVTTKDIVSELSRTLVLAHTGEVWSTPKSVITPPDGRYIMSTVAVTNDPPLVVSKSLVLNTENSSRGLPQINGLITILDGLTGLPLATMDGNWITAKRTAGLSALAAKHMANPDSSSIGFIGCGTQARSHLRVFAEIFPIERIALFGRGQPNIDELKRIALELGLDTVVCECPKAAMNGVDLVVSSISHTSVESPFLDADWLSSGAFVSITDLAVPWHKASFGLLDKIAVDDLKQEKESTQKLAFSEHVDGDLTGLVIGKWGAGRA